VAAQVIRVGTGNAAIIVMRFVLRAAVVTPVLVRGMGLRVAMAHKRRHGRGNTFQRHYRERRGQDQSF